MNNDVVLGVSDFVVLINQTLEYAYASVVIVGELANFKISKNKWVYFDLKDEFSSVRFFGTIYALPGPLEDGMVLEVRGNPRLHPQFGFSVNVQTIKPVGEGSIKKAADLLKAKLSTEGLFDESRKRPIPYPPTIVGLITSQESAAYADFIKILKQRWRGLDIRLIDVQVQGEIAVQQIVSAVEQFNEAAEQPDVLVIIRGGGSADDLQAFSTEQVTRTVAASRVPTLVAIGHEVDVSLAELAADRRASTPSNAAELLVPDRQEVLKQLENLRQVIQDRVGVILQDRKIYYQGVLEEVRDLANSHLANTVERTERQKRLIEVLNPTAILQRGYAIVRDSRGHVVRSGKSLAEGAIVNVELTDATVEAGIQHINVKD